MKRGWIVGIKEGRRNEMKKEKWYATFYARFQTPIDAMYAESALISQTPYEYHVAAKVFGRAQRRHVSQNAQNAFTGISQFLIGYIDHLGKRHSLSGQVAVTRKSGGLGPLGENFSRACDRFSNPDLEVDNMTQYLAQFV